MEVIDQESVKESKETQESKRVVKENRTDKLLRQLNVGPDFADPKLPKGYFSHSQYVSWRICAKAYEFRYVQKFRSPGYPATTKGSSVHAGIEFMLLNKRAGKVPKIEEGEAVVNDIFDKEAANVADWGEDTEGNAIEPGHVKDRALELFRTFSKHALPKINPIGIEEGFAKKIGDVPMIGWIDLIDEQPALIIPGGDKELLALAPKKLVTVDFKTGRAKWSENELKLDTQLTMYAHVKGTPDVRIDQLIDKKKGPEYVRGESTRTPDDVAIFTEDLNEVAEYVRKGIFPKTSIDNWSCNAKHCSFWSQCRGKKG